MVDAIPRAFKDVMSAAKLKDRYRMELVTSQRRPDGWVKPTARQIFEIKCQATGKKVAVIQPDGTTECMDKSFESYLDSISIRAKAEGQKVYDAFFKVSRV